MFLQVSISSIDISIFNEIYLWWKKLQSNIFLCNCYISKDIGRGSINCPDTTTWATRDNIKSWQSNLNPISIVIENVLNTYIKVGTPVLQSLLELRTSLLWKVTEKYSMVNYSDVLTYKLKVNTMCILSDVQTQY